MTLLPCPFCGTTPDIDNPATFQTNQGTKWGFVVCCCNGPEVRTGYQEASEWRDDAIKEWNTRVPAQRMTKEDLIRTICCRHGCIFSDASECLALSNSDALETANAIIVKYVAPITPEGTAFTEWLRRRGEGQS